MTAATRRMRMAVCAMALCVAAAATADEIAGTWRGNVDGTQTVLTLQRDGTAVSGDYAEGALRLRLVGTIDGSRIDARVSEPTAGLEIARFDARLDGDTLDATIDAAHPHTGATRHARATFRRDGAAAMDLAASLPGTLDRNLVGTWVNEKMINSGGANFASFTTVMTMTLGIDGRVQQWSRSVGGGSDWNYDSAGELQYAGRWSAQDGVLYVQLDGMNEFRPAGNYRFSNAYLVTENDQGRLIWQRR